MLSMLLFQLVFMLTSSRVAVLAPDNAASRTQEESLSAALLEAVQAELAVSAVSANRLTSLQILLNCQNPDEACLAEVAKLLQIDILVYSTFYASENVLVISVYDATIAKTMGTESWQLLDREALRETLRRLLQPLAKVKPRTNNHAPSFWVPMSLLGASLAAGVSANALQKARFDDELNLGNSSRDNTLRRNGILLAASADLLLLGAVFTSWRAWKKDAK